MAFSCLPKAALPLQARLILGRQASVLVRFVCIRLDLHNFISLLSCSCHGSEAGALFGLVAQIPAALLGVVRPCMYVHVGNCGTLRRPGKNAWKL